MTNKCFECKSNFRRNSRSLICSLCNNNVHLKCTLLAVRDYKYYQINADVWICNQCRSTIFPFYNVDNEELISLSFNSNTTCLCSKKISNNLTSLPQFDLLSTINKIPSLFNSDSDEQLPLQNTLNYYTVHEFHNNKDIRNTLTPHNNFSTLHINIRSLSANHDIFLNLLNDLDYNFSILGLSETKLIVDKDEVNNISIPGYNFVSKPSLSNAGGVGFFIRSDHNFTIREDLSQTYPEFESLWIEIYNNKNHNILSAVMYRHPSFNPDSFLTYLEQCVEKVNKENKYCILMGDFNLNLLNSDSHPKTEYFLNILMTNFFQPHILSPTRITHHTATLTDNIFFNSLEFNVISGSILTDISDHLPDFLIINNLSSIPSNVKLFKRDYSKFNEVMFLNELKSLHWENILPPDDNVNDIFGSFYTTLQEIVERHAPLRKVSRKEVKIRCKPWITSGIRTSIKIKDQYFRKSLNSKNPYFSIQCKIYRNKLTKLIKDSKKVYYREYFLQNNRNIKNIWKGIKQIVTLKPYNYSFPTKIMKGTIEITGTLNIANALNEYFASIGSNLASKIKKSDVSPLSYMNYSCPQSFYLSPVTSIEIEEEIDKLNVKKASGPFSIPTNLIKMAKNYLSKPLEILFNCSFFTGVVPDNFKLSCVIPVHKSGPQVNLSNYRPISLISIFNRLLKKLMYNRLSDFITKHKILYEKQFGFRSGHSTEYAISLIVHKIQCSIEKKFILMWHIY